VHWTRPALTTKVESLRERHSGNDFVQAVVDFADTLDPEDRKTLQKVLLEHRDHTIRVPLRKRR
jgi:hypothetical protein